MGTPPSYLSGTTIFVGGPPVGSQELRLSPTQRQERDALLDNPMALRIRVEDLERTRAIDAARIGELEAEVRALRAGR